MADQTLDELTQELGLIDSDLVPVQRTPPLDYAKISSFRAAMGVFHTVGDLQAATVGASIQGIRTAGYTTVGIGAGRYSRSPDQATAANPARIESFNNVYFDLDEPEEWLTQFGGLADPNAFTSPSIDSTAAVDFAIVRMNATGKQIRVPVGVFRTSHVATIVRGGFDGVAASGEDALYSSVIQFFGTGASNCLSTNGDTSEGVSCYRNIMFRAEAWTGAGACTGNGMDCSAPVICDNVWWANFKGHGLFLHASVGGAAPYYSSINDSHAVYCGGHGILVGSEASALVITNSDGKWCGAPAFGVAPTSSVVTFTASTSGNTLTVTGTPVGALGIGQSLVCPGVVGNVTIQAFGTGSGGAGTYTLSATVGSIGSQAMSTCAGTGDGIHFDYQLEGNPGGAYYSSPILGVSLRSGDNSYNSRYGLNVIQAQGSDIEPAYGEGNLADGVHQVNLDFGFSFSRFNAGTLANGAGGIRTNIYGPSWPQVQITYGGQEVCPGSAGAIPYYQRLQNFRINLLADGSGDVIDLISSGSTTEMALFGAAQFIFSGATGASYVDSSGLVIGQYYRWNDASIGRTVNIGRGTAAPTTGTWGVGDTIVNNAPAAGLPQAWTCSVAGTPGTWLPIGSFRGGAVTFASLPSAATVGAGARAFVSDLTSLTFISTAAGGGSFGGPVVSNGTIWLVG